MSRYTKPLLSLLLCLAVYLWWQLGYVGAISYHEQLQMFLCDRQYLLERIALPGGAADYIAEFLVSFFFFPKIGAAIIALLTAVLQVLSWCLIRRHAKHDIAYALSFLPAMAMWLVLGRPDVLISLPIALIAVLAAAVSLRPRAATVVIAIPVLYWLFGTMVYGLVLYWTLALLASKRWRLSPVPLLITLSTMAAAVTFLPYPPYRVLAGLNYYRFPTTIPYIIMLPMVLAAVLPFIALALNRVPRLETCSRLRVLIPAIAVVVTPCALALKANFMERAHTMLNYDYLVRTAQWSKIIAKANQTSPDMPMTVVCLNLALQQSGQMPVHQFDYFQNGTDGLLQPMTRDFTSPVPTAEAMLRLGMIDAAQEYYFEAQEAIPNFRKSGRLTRRLAETNLINGQYGVARKYLRMLRRTLFYRNWAEKTEQLLDSEQNINAHPFYGEARRNNYDQDFLYSDNEMDQMLGLLLVKNPKNRMAYEYLMSHIILKRDLRHFYDYLQLGKDMGYPNPPQVYQEVHAFLTARKNNDSRMMQQYQASPVWRYLAGNQQ